MEVEINGVKYKQKEQPKLKSSKTISKVLMMASMFGVIGTNQGSSYDDIDIVKEYELIQNKKSKLPKSKRDWVIKSFERNFEKI